MTLSTQIWPMTLSPDPRQKILAAVPAHIGEQTEVLAERARFPTLLALLALLGCAQASPPRVGPPAEAAIPGGVLTNSIGMRFVRIAPGFFWMGSPPDEEGRFEDEDLHRVKISRGFYLGLTEVTQEEWRVLMPDTDLGRREGERFPVSGITWEEAALFCRRLSEREGLFYRLPTEAEWEYACRAGTTTRFSFGGDAADLGAHAWYESNSGGGPRPVGTKRPNPWGLRDMHGNLLEWCQDVYSVRLGREPAADPAGPGRGPRRVLRGGAWIYGPGMCRSADRAGRFASGERKGVVGFRVALDLGGPPAGDRSNPESEARVPEVPAPPRSLDPSTPVTHLLSREVYEAFAARRENDPEVAIAYLPAPRLLPEVLAGPDGARTLAERVRGGVEPESWDEARTWIEDSGRHLIVVHREAAIRSVAKFLRDLKAESDGLARKAAAQARAPRKDLLLVRVQTAAATDATLLKGVVGAAGLPPPEEFPAVYELSAETAQRIYDLDLPVASHLFASGALGSGGTETTIRPRREIRIRYGDLRPNDRAMPPPPPAESVFAFGPSLAAVAAPGATAGIEAARERDHVKEFVPYRVGDAPLVKKIVNPIREGWFVEAVATLSEDRREIGLALKAARAELLRMVPQETPFGKAERPVLAEGTVEASWRQAPGGRRLIVGRDGGTGFLVLIVETDFVR